jgi:hypothetical protein
VLCDVLPLNGQEFAELSGTPEYAEMFTGYNTDGRFPAFYRVIEPLGENTCEICDFINGKLLPIWAYEPGVTAPPFHPNCGGYVQLLDKDGITLYDYYEKSESTNSMLDEVQRRLEYLGYDPITPVGPAADFLNGVISASRGKWKDAGLHFLSALPLDAIIDLFKSAKYTDEVAGAAKYADDVLDNAKYLDDIADGIKLLPSSTDVAKFADNWLDDALRMAAKGSDDVFFVIQRSVGKMLIKGGKVGGKIPLREWAAMRAKSIVNQHTDTGIFTFGEYFEDERSYTIRAGNTSFFDMGDGWKQTMKRYDLSKGEMFELFNKPAIDDAFEAGMQFRFTHDPRKVPAHTSLFQEWKYIQSLYESNAKLEEEGGFWYVRRLF